MIYLKPSRFDEMIEQKIKIFIPPKYSNISFSTASPEQRLDGEIIMPSVPERGHISIANAYRSMILA